jgi:DNA-binding transcriptional LysR family regulator
MNLDQLTVFLAVSRHLHFSRAAEELYITQPAVSASVAKLEGEFRIKLFHRIGRRVELTDAGRFLAREGQRLLEQVSQLERRLLEFNALKRGVLTIGASFTVGNYWLPAALKNFHDSHPNIEVQCGLGNAEQVLEGTARGEYDLGFLSGSERDPLPEQLAAEAVGRERLQVVVAEGHPWFGCDRVDPYELSTSQWVMRERGSGARQMFADGLQGIEIALDSLPVSLVLNSSEMVKMVVLNGGGAAALPESMIRHEVSLNLLWPVQVDGLVMAQSILMIRHAQRHQSAVLMAFEDGVREPLNELF